MATMKENGRIVVHDDPFDEENEDKANPENDINLTDDLYDDDNDFDISIPYLFIYKIQD